MQDRIITAQLDEEEKRYEATLRPPTLSEYIGQEKVKDNLNIFIEAAKRRGEALDHVLFYGPPGLGKTTLAYIISRELGVGIKATSVSLRTRHGSVAAIHVTTPNLEVPLIDEIHRL